MGTIKSQMSVSAFLREKNRCVAFPVYCGAGQFLGEKVVQSVFTIPLEGSEGEAFFITNR